MMAANAPEPIMPIISTLGSMMSLVFFSTSCPETSAGVNDATVVPMISAISSWRSGKSADASSEISSTIAPTVSSITTASSVSIWLVNT